MVSYKDWTEYEWKGIQSYRKRPSERFSLFYNHKKVWVLAQDFCTVPHCQYIKNKLTVTSWCSTKTHFCPLHSSIAQWKEVNIWFGDMNLWHPPVKSLLFENHGCKFQLDLLMEAYGNACGNLSWKYVLYIFVIEGHTKCFHWKIWIIIHRGL